MDPTSTPLRAFSADVTRLLLLGVGDADRAGLAGCWGPLLHPKAPGLLWPFDAQTGALCWAGATLTVPQMVDAGCRLPLDLWRTRIAEVVGWVVGGEPAPLTALIWRELEQAGPVPRFVVVDGADAEYGRDAEHGGWVVLQTTRPPSRPRGQHVTERWHWRVSDGQQVTSLDTVLSTGLHLPSLGAHGQQHRADVALLLALDDVGAVSERIGQVQQQGTAGRTGAG